MTQPVPRSWWKPCWHALHEMISHEMTLNRFSPRLHSLGENLANLWRRKIRRSWEEISRFPWLRKPLPAAWFALRLDRLPCGPYRNFFALHHCTCGPPFNLKHRPGIPNLMFSGFAVEKTCPLHIFTHMERHICPDHIELMGLVSPPKLGMCLGIWHQSSGIPQAPLARAWRTTTSPVPCRVALLPHAGVRQVFDRYSWYGSAACWVRYTILQRSLRWRGQ